MERSFSDTADKRNGLVVLPTVEALKVIGEYLEHHIADTTPFVWGVDADPIVNCVMRL